MARLCDIIEEFIKQMIQETNGTIEIQRNELAIKFNCVPSQINYVISTRFSNGQGYYVESRRGGGGNIRISRVNINYDGNYFMHIISSMGDTISQQTAEIFINNFFDYKIITEREASIIKAAISDRILFDAGVENRDTLRTLILKNIMTSIIK